MVPYLPELNKFISSSLNLKLLDLESPGAEVENLFKFLRYRYVISLESLNKRKIRDIKMCPTSILQIFITVYICVKTLNIQVPRYLTCF